MEIFTLLENLEELIENGSKVPFSNKVMIDTDEVKEVLEEIRRKLPDELKQAKWVKEERQRILMDAQKEADEIVKQTETKIISLVDDHEITKQALAKKEEILESADKVAREISDGTREYADALLERLEEILNESLNVIKNNRKELKM